MSAHKNKRNQTSEQEKIRAMDRRWFESNPTRNFLFRLAVPSEVEMFKASHIIVRNLGKGIRLRVGMLPFSLPKCHLHGVPDEQLALMWDLLEECDDGVRELVRKLKQVIAKTDTAGN